MVLQSDHFQMAKFHKPEILVFLRGFFFSLMIVAKHESLIPSQPFSTQSPCLLCALVFQLVVLYSFWTEHALRTPLYPKKVSQNEEGTGDHLLAQKVDSPKMNFEASLIISHDLGSTRYSLCFFDTAGTLTSLSRRLDLPD